MSTSLMGLMVAAGMTTQDGSELLAALVIGKSVAFMRQWAAAEELNAAVALAQR